VNAKRIWKLNKEFWANKGLPLQQEMIDYCRNAPLSRTADQQFLRERVWPTVRQSVLMHDSEYSLRDSLPFPSDPKTGEPRVGQAVADPPIGWDG